MAITIKDGNAALLTVKSTLSGADQVPHHIVESSALPTGASTSALQSTGNASLSSIDGKLATLGQNAIASSVSVVLATAHAAVSIQDGGNSITVDGTVAATQSGVWNVGDGGGSLTVDGTVAATQSGTWNVGSITTLPALATGANTIGSIASITVAINPGVAATNLGKAIDSVMGATDTGVAMLAVRRDSPTALTPAAGDYAVPQIDSTGAAWVHPTLGTTGGLTPYQLISAATTNATSVKASAGTVGSLVVTNNHATNIAYLKLYNKATAPTVGTDTPVQTYALAALGGGVAIDFSNGLAFGTGIAFALTGGMAVADTAAVAVSQVSVNIGYK